MAAPPPAPAEPDIPQELQLFDTSGPPPQTISHGGQVIELRRLTPEEKAARRTRRTIVTIGTGTAILFAIVLLATRGGGKQKRR